MTPTDKVTHLLLRGIGALAAGFTFLRDRAAREEGDRGDVPGWVMITLMTAIVVVALLAVFRDEVVDAVSNAFSSIQ